jgi:carboxyl-terminal processing protease
MEKADSIKFNDTITYKTPAGRILYGGGGIMPDFFVPIDTSHFSKYYYEVYDKGLIYRFAFYYSDANRKVLSKFKTYQQLQAHIKKQNIFEKFVNYAEEHGVKKNADDLKISSPLIRTELEACIVRNFYDNAGYFPICNTIDITVRKALEIFQPVKQRKHQ